MKQLAIAALAVVASAFSAADIQAQQNPPAVPKVAPTNLRQPTVIDLSKPLPKTIDITVGRSIIFENGTSKITAAETDGKGQIFKEQFVQAKVTAYYRTVRVGSGEITVTNGAQVDKITVNVMYPPRPAHKGPAVQPLPRPQAPVKVDLSKPLPKQLQLSVGQRVVLVNGATLKTEVKDTDGKGKLLQPRPARKDAEIIIFEATREGKGELKVTFPNQGKLTVIHTETIPVEVIAPPPAPAPNQHHGKGLKPLPLPRPKAAVQVDLSKALPQKIQLTVGQKVVLFNDKAKVEAKETDGKGGLLKDVPHKLPNVEMYIFEATREGKGELKLAFPNTGLATKPRLETIPVEVTAPPPAPAPKPKQQPGKPAIKKAGVIGTTIEGPIMGNPPNIPGKRIANYAPVANATIIFKDANNKEAGRTTSDQQGKFSIDLPEGDYIVESEHPNKDKQSGLPRNYQGKVTVGKNGRSWCVIRYDTRRP